VLVSTDRVLMTKRCALRYPRLADAPFILDVVTHPSFPRELPFAQLTTIQAIVGAINRRHMRWHSGTALSWCVDERASGCLVGMVSISREPDPNSWNLAFWVHPANWRQGFATEFGQEALRLAFGELGAQTVEAGVAIWNTASQGVIEKLGFAFQRENPDGYQIQGRPVRTREYSISVGHWAVGGLPPQKRPLERPVESLRNSHDDTVAVSGRAVPGIGQHDTKP